jgi:hypothetical protein
MLIHALLSILDQMKEAFVDLRVRRRVVDLAMGLICGDKPKTITSALEWLAVQDEQWSPAYRMLSEARCSRDKIFAPILQGVMQLHPDPSIPLFVGQDDTLIRKSGRKIPGTSIARDPLSPPFHPNLVLGQRFLQTSVMVNLRPGERPSRAIPVRFAHAPPLKPPPRASAEVREAIRKERKHNNISRRASQELHQLRVDIDQLPRGVEYTIIDAVDGGFANSSFLRDLPERTVAVARIRKDASLRALLAPQERKGNRKYGEKLPSPEQYLQDPSVPWQTMSVFVAGAQRTLRYKIVEPVCWPKATLDMPLRLIVIKAAGYRMRKGSNLLYRQPAYLICTSLTMNIEHIIQAYLARWEVEVSFRDEKTGLGVGQAQVWNPCSVERTPAFIVACYGALLLATIKHCGDERTDEFGSLPAWRTDTPSRPSLRDIIRLVRKQAEIVYTPRRQIGLKTNQSKHTSAQIAI